MPFVLLSGTRIDNLSEIPVYRRPPGGVLALGFIFVREFRCVGTAVPALDIQTPTALLFNAPYVAATGAVLQADLVKVIRPPLFACLP